MEYGMMPKIEQFSDNTAIATSKVQSSQATEKFDVDASTSQIKQEAISKDNNAEMPKYEVELSNTTFGYNEDSKDFYVKTVRGNVENQYPTEQMMRIKSYMMEQQAKQGVE